MADSPSIPYGIHRDDEKVERNVSVELKVGSLFRHDDDRFYLVEEVWPHASPFGPRWDVRLRLVAPDVQIAAEIMLT